MSRRFFRLFCVFLAALFVGEAGAQTALALDGRFLSEFAENNILYYDPDWTDDENPCRGTSGCSILGELRTKMWNAASKEDKEHFMYVVGGESDTLAGIEAYMNMVIARSNGNLHDWIHGLCPQFRGGRSCTGSSKIPKKEQGWIDRALAGSNVTNIATGNASWSANGGDAGTGGPLTCLWENSDNEDGGSCKSDVDYSKKPFKDGGKCSEMIQAAGGDINSGWECWAWDNTAQWSEEMVKKCGASGGSSGEVIGDNKDYAGNQVWTDKELERIERFKPLYQKAAKKAGIPWEMLAAVHKRETNLSDVNPSDNDDGIFQQTEQSYPMGNKVTDEEFIEQATITAKQLKANMGDGTDDNSVKKAFFAYNGMASAYISQANDLGFSKTEAENGEGSPYVMNKADEKRDPNKNPNGWGQIKHDHGGIEYPANQDYGAFVYYKALAGGGSVCISGNGNINDTAILLSWPDRSHSPDDPKPEYRQALKDNGIVGLGDGCSDVGKSCDAFVATVMRESGADPDFLCCGANRILTEYLTQHPELYEEIPNTGKASDLKPGDIRSKPSHIEMYIEVDGVGKIASASHCNRTGDHGIDFYTDMDYRIFRWKGGV